MCRFTEDHSRVFVIAVLLTMALWSCTRVITDVAESSPTSSFGPFQSFLILGLGWWAGFATSSLPLRLAGWLGGVAAMLVVDVHRFAQVSADPVWWSEWQWLIFWSHCGTLFLEASAAFSTFLLCRHIPWSGGIRVERVDCGSSDSRGAGAQRRWGIALDFLILGAVVSAIAFLLDEMMPLVWWPGSNAFKGIALVSAGTWALGITSGAASAIVVMAVAWLLLGQGRFLNKMAIVVVGCFVYLAQTLWLLHPALCESRFLDWFVELAKLSAVSVLVFALLRFGGYRLGALGRGGPG
ncbi:MAG: hypothetical protein ACOCWL_03530 [Thermoguttaceae bacterium]